MNDNLASWLALLFILVFIAFMEGQCSVHIETKEVPHANHS